MASTVATYVVLSVGYALILSRSITHLRTAWYYLGIHISVLFTAVGFLFGGKFRHRHELLFLTVSQRHSSKLGSLIYCFIEVKALLLFVVISAIPLPKIYKVLSGKRSTLLPSARNSAQTLEGNTTSSKCSRILRASISFFSDSDWELVYGDKTVRGNSALRNNEVDIPPPLESALGNQQQTELDVKEAMGIGGRARAEREEQKKGELNGIEKLVRQHQLMVSRTFDEPQQSAETNSDDTQINSDCQEPGLAKKQGKEPRQRETQEGNEKAEDRTEKGSCEAWCCGCGRIEMFPLGMCDNCGSSLCSSCIRMD